MSISDEMIQEKAKFHLIGDDLNIAFTDLGMC